MTKVDFLLHDGLITGFTITDHAEYGEEGSDILCAAISSAAYMTVNTITDILGIVVGVEVKYEVIRFQDSKITHDVRGRMQPLP